MHYLDGNGDQGSGMEIGQHGSLGSLSQNLLNYPLPRTCMYSTVNDLQSISSFLMCDLMHQ